MFNVGIILASWLRSGRRAGIRCWFRISFRRQLTSRVADLRNNFLKPARDEGHQRRSRHAPARLGFVVAFLADHSVLGKRGAYTCFVQRWPCPAQTFKHDHLHPLAYLTWTQRSLSSRLNWVAHDIYSKYKSVKLCGPQHTVVFVVHCPLMARSILKNRVLFCSMVQFVLTLLIAFTALVDTVWLFLGEFVNML